MHHYTQEKVAGRLMRKALIITWEGFQDHEVVYPYYRIREKLPESDVCLMSNKLGRIFGILGVHMDSNALVSDLSGNFEKYFNEYSLLVLPGGVKSLEKLRQEKDVVSFISEWNKRGKLIASTCHGAQLLISAKCVAGRRISSYYSISVDVENAGATYVDAPFVTDGNIVSSPHYKWMGEWMGEVMRLFEAGA